jgi:sortase A
MSDGKQSPRRLSTILVAAVVVLLIVVGGYLVVKSYRGAQPRREVRQTPQATGTDIFVAVASATPSPAPASPAIAPAVTSSPVPNLTPTPVVAEPTRPAPTATETGSSEPLLPTATPVPAAVTVPAPAPTATLAPVVTPVLASVPVRLVIPNLKIDVPVVEMGWKVVQTASGPRSDWVIPKDEAGHHINSALLGEEGNLVISGHNNIYGEVFKPISFAWDNDTRIPIDNFTDRSDVLNGRTVELFDAAGQEFKYTISAFYRLKDTGAPLQQRIANARFMEPTDQAQVTLITCWPPTSNTHRLVVVAVPATN